MQKLVTKHGKAVVGWDEVFIPGVPKDIVIQSWRGQASLAEAASQGYRGILSNGYYIDLGWTAARHYAVDPMGGAAANLTPEQQKLILGGEATHVVRVRQRAKTSIRASGRAAPRSPSASGRRKAPPMSPQCTFA